jgi:hypothetical protein
MIVVMGTNACKGGQKWNEGRADRRQKTEEDRPGCGSGVGNRKQQASEQRMSRSRQQPARQEEARMKSNMGRAFLGEEKGRHPSPRSHDRVVQSIDSIPPINQSPNNRNLTLGLGGAGHRPPRSPSLVVVSRQ